MFCLSVRYGNHSSDMVGQVYRILLLQLHNSACQEAGKETFGDAFFIFFCTSVTRSYEGTSELSCYIIHGAGSVVNH